MRQRRFALLLGGLAVNAIGSWTSLIAIWGYATYRYHAGPGMVAVLVACWSGPSAVLGPIAGTPIDRLGPRRVLLTGYLVTAGVASAMALSGTLTALVVLVTIYGILRAFSIPAADALPPRVVEPADLLSANALFGAWWLDGMVALGIAGWAVAEGRRAWPGDRAAAHPSQACPADTAVRNQPSILRLHRLSSMNDERTCRAP